MHYLIDMKLSYKKTDSYLKMIQGKIVQEALFYPTKKMNILEQIDKF